MINKRIDRLFSYHFRERFPKELLGRIKRNGVRAYWYREHTNFGDLLTPFILSSLGFTAVHGYPSRALVASAGSILEHLPNDFSGFIIGSGFLRAESLGRFPRARILAVRGALTRERLGADRSLLPLGDPGLYAVTLMGASRREISTPLGVVPHHSNFGLPAISAIKSRSPDAVKIVTPIDAPEAVISELSKCELIVSYSLHGLVVADALGIPSVWCLDNALIGGPFKFLDYATSVNRTHWRPVELQGAETFASLRAMASRASPDSVEQCQETVKEAFRRFTLELDSWR